MKVILLENIRRIGSIGEVIEVKRGFARNYLISNKKALYASKENITEVEKIKTELGKKDAENSEKTAKDVFAINSTGSSLPSIKIKKGNIDKKFTIIDLIIFSKLENSKSEIRRLIKGNAVKLNDKVIVDEKLIIKSQLFKKNYLKLSIGKKRHIKFEKD